MGTAIAKAQENGNLHLEQEVQTLLANENFRIDNPDSHPITLRHLITHQSGIDDSQAYLCSYYIDHGDGTHTKLVNLRDAGFCPESSPITLNGFLAAYLDNGGEFYNLEQNFTGQTPGQEYLYSNIGASLAGYAMKVATGFSLADYAQREIFTPPGHE
ncbi:serine hydrolase [Microbulbifer epialgicus]|uniref:Serine hydrolase n=1 Tax=Microbulbifer epialgicus TaxID=393907 RepID=A0ABV4P777_9GAMM